MICSASAKLALTATIGLGVISLAPPAIAVQFAQAEVDQSRFIAIAAPIGNGNSHKLLILEQLSNNRSCWQENPGQVTTVDPLLLNFDFTNICARSTDSNGYSVRIGGEDLSLRYQLVVVRKGDDLVLLAASTQTLGAPPLEIGRTRGLTNQFAKIYLNPGWRLARRTFQGQPVGHIYLTTDHPPGTLLASTKQSTLNQSGTLPGSGPTQASSSIQNQPAQVSNALQPGTPVTTTNQRPTPARTATNSSAVVVQTLPTETISNPLSSGSSSSPNSDRPIPDPQPGLVDKPAAILPDSRPSSIPIPVPQPDRLTMAPPETMALPTVSVTPTRLPVPSLTPPVSEINQAPPDSTPVVSGNSLPNPPSFNSANSGNSVNSGGLTSASYRVVVQTATPEQQNQVRQLVPGAFRTTVNGQSVMQAGVFRDRATADALQQRLTQQNLPAIVMTNALTEVRVPASPGATATIISKPPTMSPQGSIASGSLAGFNLPVPNTSGLQSSSLWATYYYLHQAQTITKGNPLFDPAGNHLGVELSDRDWCAAALQGSVVISDGSRLLGTFNYAGRGNNIQVDCSAYYPNLRTVNATSRSRFQRSNTPFGEGVRGNQLVPYRTVAVDPNLIPIGSVLYIPAARGVSITLPSGERMVHDGYFYAADVGGAIQGNHIDVFIGPGTTNPFDFVRSTQSGTFQAFLVNDPQIQTQLASLHRPISQTARLP